MVRLQLIRIYVIKLWLFSNVSHTPNTRTISKWHLLLYWLIIVFILASFMIIIIFNPCVENLIAFYIYINIVITLFLVVINLHAHFLLQYINIHIRMNLSQIDVIFVYNAFFWWFVIVWLWLIFLRATIILPNKHNQKIFAWKNAWAGLHFGHVSTYFFLDFFFFCIYLNIYNSL